MTEILVTPQQEKTQVAVKKSLAPFAIIGIIILILIGYFISNKRNSTITTPSQFTDGPVKTFVVDGSNYSFEPKTITVGKGDNVKIDFKDDDGMHNLVVEGYGITTKTLQEGGSDSISFVADKAGVFEYYCSVGNHKDRGMVGTLTVQ